MMNCRRAATQLLLVVVSASIVSTAVPESDGTDSISIPFELHGANIRMQGLVNGHTCDVLLDNGSLWDDLLFFGSEKVDGFGLVLDGTVTLGDEDATNPIIADTSSGITLGLVSLSFPTRMA